MPRLVTFDIFGTVVDWRTGLREAVRSYGRDLSDEDFEHVIDAQAVDEHGPFRTYAEITAESLVRTLGLDRAAAESIGEGVGRFPPFEDSREALLALLQHCECVAMTNSDRVHGEQAQQRLGLRFSDWVCAEEIQIYKPRPEFWRAVAARRGVAMNKEWWHVSAYADFDLETASSVGVTTVFIERPHRRPAPADLTFADLKALAVAVEAT